MSRGGAETRPNAPSRVDAIYRELEGRERIGSKGRGRLGLFAEMGKLAAELAR